MVCMVLHKRLQSGMGQKGREDCCCLLPGPLWTVSVVPCPKLWVEINLFCFNLCVRCFVLATGRVTLLRFTKVGWRLKRKKWVVSFRKSFSTDLLFCISNPNPSLKPFSTFCSSLCFLVSLFAFLTFCDFVIKYWFLWFM